MCELFGVSAPSDFTANDYLTAFYRRSENHPHGWGLACASRSGVQIEKESVKASDSNYLRERLSQPVASKILLAHIRYATIGNVAYQNCHPFSGTDSTGRRWTLVHNGTIFDYPPLSSYLKTQNGDTDSERVFLYLLDRLNAAQRQKREQGERLRFEERFRLFDGIISDMAKGNKLNLLFTDGKYLFVHTNCRGTLHVLHKDGTTLVATKPLTDEAWQPVPMNRLQAYCRGKLLLTGGDHGNEYIESEEAMQLLYRIFANL